MEEPVAHQPSPFFKALYLGAALLALASLLVLGYLLLLLVLGPKSREPLGILHLRPLDTQSTSSATF